MDELTPNWDLLDHVVRLSDAHLEPEMGKWINALKGKSAKEVKDGLKEVLDMSAHGALASGFVMKVLDIEWQRLGGRIGDPVSERILKLTDQYR